MISDFSSVTKHLVRTLSLFSLLYLIGLTSCAPALPPSHFHHTAQEASFIPAQKHLIMSDGASIPIRFYPSQMLHPKAIILAFHGFGDSRDAWENIAPAFAAQNILILAPDVRSFGETTATYRWSNTNRMVSDALEERALIQKNWPNTPLYIMGESMGGAIALLLSTYSTHHQPVAGTILLAPATIDIGQPWQGILNSWDFLFPQHVLTGQHLPGHRIATDNVPALRRMFFDPLTQHSSTVHALNGLTHLMTDALHSAPHVHDPLLLLYGSKDQFVPSFSIQTLLKSLPETTRFDYIMGGHHLLSRDNRNVAEDILTWINTPNKFLPSGGDFSTIQWDFMSNY